MRLNLSVTAAVCTLALVLAGMGRELPAQPPVTLARHAGQINTLAFAPDGKTLVTGGADQQVIVWNLETGAVLTERKTNGEVTQLAYSPDGRKLAMIGTIPEVHVYDVATDMVVRTLRRLNETSVGAAIAFSPDSKFLAASDVGSPKGAVQVWNLETEQEVWKLPEAHASGVNGIAFSPNGQWVATGGQDQAVKLWAARTGQLVRTYDQRPAGAVTSVAFTPDSQRLVVGAGRNLRLFDLSQPNNLLPLFDIPVGTETDVVRTVLVRPDGKTIVTGTTAGVVTLWDAATGSRGRDAKLSGPTTAFAYNADASRLAAVDGRVVIIWPQPSAMPAAQPVAVQPMAAASPVPKAVAEKTTVELVREVENAIVRIDSRRTFVSKDPQGNEARFVEFSGGTGFLIEGGYVVTNCHVFPGIGPEKQDPNVVVRSQAGTLICELIGSDELLDLAVLKVVLSPPKALLTKEGRLPALKFADHRGLRVGQDVVAIGFGRLFEIDGQPSVTRGILSADQRATLNSSLRMSSNLLQTDAVVNQGNSGGPLLNMRGEVVGVNTYLLVGTPDDPIQGIFFARSCETAGHFVQALIENRTIFRADIGIDSVSLQQNEIDKYALVEGVLITVKKDSPAAVAGLKDYDVIYEIDKYRIRNSGDLDTALAYLHSATVVEVRYLRPSPESVEQLKKEQVSDDEGFAQAVRERRFKTVKVTLK